MVTQIVGDRLAGSDETAQRCNRLGEGAHDEVYLVAQAKVIAHAATALAEDADTMSLVNHDVGIVLVGQIHDVGQLAHVAFHREDAVGDNELDTVRLALLELRFKRSHIVVLVLQGVGERETTSLNDRGMVLLIPQYIVIPAGKSGNDAQINTETGAVNHRILLALILGKLALELLVQVESTVKERRTGTSGAVFLGGLDCGLLDALIVYQA